MFMCANIQKGHEYDGNKKTEENLALAITTNSCAASCQNLVHEANMLLPLKEKHMGLMKSKEKFERQLGEIGISLREVEEEMKKLKSKLETANALLLIELTTQVESDKTVLTISKSQMPYQFETSLQGASTLKDKSLYEATVRGNMEGFFHQIEGDCHFQPSQPLRKLVASCGCRQVCS
ncbi:hypothetical protein V6N12_060388 [Hibiscus sabdariffa]|uniref:Uncharacterized protein n=1 Tax=Hibiscus sabdariffa TaxID=183260 RepID=A0ABR2D499_9ROSI